MARKKLKDGINPNWEEHEVIINRIEEGLEVDLWRITVIFNTFNITLEDYQVPSGQCTKENCVEFFAHEIETMRNYFYLRIHN